MVPPAFVSLDALPLTPNGKIDRLPKNLPVPDTEKAAREREFTQPATDAEKRLAAIWAEVLHLDRVGIHDNLFELGADSLHIFQIAARAAKAGITIAPAQFLRHRTIASLLAQLDNTVSGAPNGSLNPMPSIVPVSRDKYRVRRPA
jgi:aryl carrier-like protein